jgi:hypothetical protein
VRAFFAAPAPARCVACLMCVLASGCSSMGVGDIPAANVSPDQYQGQTCEHMKAEAQQLNAKKSDLSPVLFPSISEQDREHQLSEVNGELNALAKASANCGK